MSTYIKHTVKALLLGLFCLTLMISMISCADGIDTDEAKEFIEDFFEVVENEDYEGAGTFLHPERPADIKTFFEGVESETGIDFSSGIEIEKYSGFRYSYYDSTVGGSAYEVTIKASVGDKAVKFIVEIVKNDQGYGIYNFDIDT